MKLKQMLYVAFAAVFIAICSWIVIPSPIPFSMQTFGIFLLLFIFGGKSTFSALCIYILLGLMGAPVFAGFRGGAAILFSNTGGYLIGFLLCSLVYMSVSPPESKKSSLRIPASLAGLLICYICGILWYMAVNSLWSFAGFRYSFVICVLPFILPDIIKLFIAYTVSGRLSSGIYRLNKRR